MQTVKKADLPEAWCENCKALVEVEYEAKIIESFAEKQWIEEKRKCRKCGRILKSKHRFRNERSRW